MSQKGRGRRQLTSQEKSGSVGQEPYERGTRTQYNLDTVQKSKSKQIQDLDQLLEAELTQSGGILHSVTPDGEHFSASCKGVFPNSFPGTQCSRDEEKTGYLLHELLLSQAKVARAIHNSMKNKLWKPVQKYKDGNCLYCALLTSILILFFKFTESEEVYQRQVLSISCIIFGIVIVAMFCAAFYFRSKKQAKQIQEQLKEPQNAKHYSLKASSAMAKPENLVKSHVQLQNYSKVERHPVTALEKMMESSFAGHQSFPEVPSPDRASQCVKHHRSLSSCCSPGQRSGMPHRNAFRRTPPSPRSRLGGIVGPAYQQLEESRIPDQETIPCQGLSIQAVRQFLQSRVPLEIGFGSPKVNAKQKNRTVLP
ncbi:hypothetical protein MC885_001966 [Smutsia gigantea]|nr:hypothetical protein MC885_001966 [Smutsia gigantea]